MKQTSSNFCQLMYYKK